MRVLLSTLISLFDPDYLIAYESCEDYMPVNYSERLPELLRAEPPGFSAYIQPLANQKACPASTI